MSTLILRPYARSLADVRGHAELALLLFARTLRCEVAEITLEVSTNKHFPEGTT